MYTKMYISVFLCYFLIMITGIIGGWTSPMVQKLNITTDNPLKRILTDSEVSWLASIPSLGSISGSVLFGYLAETIGKKWAINVMAFSYLLFFFIMLFSKVYWLYIMARFLSGVGTGGVLVHLPVYIYELALPKLRKRLNTLMYVSQNIGMLITFCTVSRMSFYYYHLAFLPLPIVFIILFAKFGTESPHSIVSRDVEEAEHILKQLRAKSDVAQEFQEIRASTMETSSVGLVDIFLVKKTRASFMTSLGLAIFVTSSGSGAIMSYIHFILNSTGGTRPAQVDIVILGIVQLITTIISSNITDHRGQKQLLTISYLVSSLSQAVLGIYFLMKDIIVDKSRSFGWIPLASLMLYITAYTIQVTLTGLISVLILPGKNKYLANLVCSVYTALSGFLIIFYFNTMQEAIGLGQCFLVFSSFGIFALAFVRRMLITEAKSLESTEHELNDNLGNSCEKLGSTVYGTID